MRLIDADALMRAMYHRAFETDGDTMWQSGCWVRYRAIEQTVKEQPTIQPDNSLQKLADEIAKYKRTMRSDNSDYFTGYMSALSMVEGMIADMMPHEPYEGVTT